MGILPMFHGLEARGTDRRGRRSHTGRVSHRTGSTLGGFHSGRVPHRTGSTPDGLASGDARRRGRGSLSADT